MMPAMPMLPLLPMLAMLANAMLMLGCVDKAGQAADRSKMTIL